MNSVRHSSPSLKRCWKEAAGTAANECYDEIEQILNADDYLSKIDTKASFSSGSFHLAFLGVSANSGTWQLYFGGHHLAVLLTYKDGEISGATASFRDVEPFGASFTQNGRENQPLNQERDAFAAMLNALDDNEKNKAKLSRLSRTSSPDRKRIVISHHPGAVCESAI